ncbi:chondroitin sulfate N-acetylgalactosaminyltransferase 2-like [Pollicipes pollicipes]|uniref:chondroitin sulfate N-acetylgalactosaminyltransferase 2-like n=1 Tax=Pollicipes pollicipes TaxID=41117 RepID=UPI0018859B86|nr:chondroitin sulfate N-acetylgalactosaminyltransferase 2-like [Pollicipes pollicipes]
MATQAVRTIGDVMSFRLHYKKLAGLGLVFVLLLVIRRLLLSDGYPQMTFNGEPDGANDFNRVKFQDMSALVPFESFTTHKRYTLDVRPSYAIALPLMELEKDNVAAIITEALEQSKPVTGGAISERHFQYGLSRHLPGVGEEYNLVFRNGIDVFSARVYRKVGAPLVSVTRHEALRQQPLHIVMPLSGRVQRLRTFLHMLGALIDDGDNVRLTVVAFADGPNGTRPVEEELRRWQHTARARLVVDSVYYPILFSRFNPQLQEALQQGRQWPPGPAIGPETGNWRDYGFGMVCQYGSDFAAVSGAYMDTDGWGGEDVALYTRYLSRYRVVRAFDPDMEHTYHGKECSDSLSAGTYRSCVLSKIQNEGSKRQLGLLAFTLGGELAPRARTIFHLRWHQRVEGWVALVLAVLLTLSLVLNVRLYRRRAPS